MRYFGTEVNPKLALEHVRARKKVNSASYAASNIKLSIMNGKEMPLNVAVPYEGELQNLLFRSEDAKDRVHSSINANRLGPCV